MKKIFIIFFFLLFCSQANAITFNFKDAELTDVIEAFALLVGKSYIIDSRVVGKVNVISTEEMDIIEAEKNQAHSCGQSKHHVPLDGLGVLASAAHRRIPPHHAMQRRISSRSRCWLCTASRRPRFLIATCRSLDLTAPPPVAASWQHAMPTCPLSHPLSLSSPPPPLAVQL